MFLRRKSAALFLVSIEYNGELFGPEARLATSPEIFRVFARSKRAARGEAVRVWSDKYRASERTITRVLVAGPGERLSIIEE